ncbi:MAG: ABC transporter permease [Bacilli bacterium]|nr:ABC transporter permease [Bacilli bacterium]
MFWSFAFPIVLGLLFNLAFKDIEKNESFSSFDIAIVNSEEYLNNPIYKEAYTSLSEGDDKLFDINYVSKEEADVLLEDKEIVGYLEFSESVSITINQNGINETILKFVVDEIESNKEMINSLIQKRLENNKYSEIELIIGEIKSKVLNTSVSLKDQTKDNISYTMIEYYTLIAMTALYGGTIAIYITNLKLANMGSIGKRTAVTAIKKSSLLLSSLLASYLIQILELALLFLFTIFVLSVDYGNNLLYIIILALIGSFAGLTLGVAIATLIRASENTKTGILIAVTMFGCFLSGMMGITMKYVVDTYAPLVNLVNPAALITDGFYNLYYYGLNDNFILDLILLLVFSAVMLLISYRGLRRQKYDSI